MLFLCTRPTNNFDISPLFLSHIHLLHHPIATLSLSLSLYSLPLFSVEIMAVHAHQYPSNVLLLNRNTQEGKNSLGNDYSLQPQPGGAAGAALFDQAQTLFNPTRVVGSNNSRKRSREMMTPTATTMNSSNPLIALQQHHQPQLIDLTQLHTPQNNPNNVVSTGLRLAFGDQLQQQPHHHSQQHQYSLSPQSSVQSSALLSILSDDFASHIKQQREEIDNFIQVQGEQLRRALAEKRQRNFRALLGAAEESAARRLREKEMEVEKAARRNAELEARAAQLSAEAQAWQSRARAQEVTAATLQAQIQQAMLSSGGCSAERDEWGGGGVEGVGAEDNESAYIDPDRVDVLSGPSCKACRRRIASMVVLPCRHLCLCKECDAVARCCALCFTFRTSSVEAILG